MRENFPFHITYYSYFLIWRFSSNRTPLCRKVIRPFNCSFGSIPLSSFPCPPPPPPQSAYPDPHISAGKMLTPPCQIFLTNRQIYIKERERKSAKERWVIEKANMWCVVLSYSTYRTQDGTCGGLLSEKRHGSTRVHMPQSLRAVFWVMTFVWVQKYYYSSSQPEQHPSKLPSR